MFRISSVHTSSSPAASQFFICFKPFSSSAMLNGLLTMDSLLVSVEIFFFFLMGYVEERPMVAYTKLQQRKKEESEQLRG